jgi:hypothetical protein
MGETSSASLFGPPPTRPQFDTEVAAVYAAMPPGSVPYLLTDETLPGIRGRRPEVLPGYRPPDLTDGGRVVIQDRVVPGPVGAPDITVTIMRPSASTTVPLSHPRRRDDHW